jgi:hypothetical protein
MSSNPETPLPEQAKPAGARLGKTVRWAVRITSIPIFGLLLLSLVPALASFSISANDDKIIALGMCATAVGFALGWRWPGPGGALAALGVGAMLSQADGSIFGDPFSIAFGLQAVLFLISWAVNSPPGKTTAPRITWIKRAAVGLLVVAVIAGVLAIYRGPGPMRVPKEKEAFVGVWDNGAGFVMEITSDGRAKIRQEKDAKVEACNTPLPAGGEGEFLVSFPTDDRLELSSGVLQSPKVYHIDRRPMRRSKEIKLVLNASDPYQPRSGLVLVKKQIADTRRAKPSGTRPARPAEKSPLPAAKS